MNAVGYVIVFGYLIETLTIAGLTFRTIEMVLRMQSNGNSISEILRAVKKKILVAIFVACFGSVMAIIKKYYQ